MEIKILNNRGKYLILINIYEEAIDVYKELSTFKLETKSFLKIRVCYYAKKI